MPEPEYPEGKLNKEDEGALAVALGIENGKVVITYPKPIAWIAFSPTDAITFGEAVIAKAYEAIEAIKH